MWSSQIISPSCSLRGEIDLLKGTVPGCLCRLSSATRSEGALRSLDNPLAAGPAGASHPAPAGASSTALRVHMAQDCSCSSRGEAMETAGLKLKEILEFKEIVEGGRGSSVVVSRLPVGALSLTTQDSLPLLSQHKHSSALPRNEPHRAQRLTHSPALPASDSASTESHSSHRPFFPCPPPLLSAWGLLGKTPSQNSVFLPCSSSLFLPSR